MIQRIPSSATAHRVPELPPASFETPATYTPPHEQPLAGAPRRQLALEYLERAFTLALIPGARLNLLEQIQKRMDIIRELPVTEASRLGELMGQAKTAAVPTYARWFEDGSQEANWLLEFSYGLSREWPEALSRVIRGFNSGWPQLLPLLWVMDTRQALRTASIRALGVGVSAGSPVAFRALETAALRAETPAEKSTVVQTLCASGLQAITNLAQARDVQEAVDIAVGLVDVSLKTGQLRHLDELMSRLAPDELAAEVILAFLTTSAPAANSLPARTKLLERFRHALMGRRRPDAEELLRFAS